MSDHAKLSPSGAHRWMNCTGALTWPDEESSSSYAEDGTWKHAVLKAYMDGRKLVAGETFQHPTKQIEKILDQTTLDQVHDIKVMVEKWDRTSMIDAEVPVDMSTIWGFKTGTLFGESDIISYTDEALLVVDAKFGMVRVSAVDNPQLIMYALGAIAKYKLWDTIKTIDMWILQPDFDGEVQPDRHRMTIEALREWVKKNWLKVEEAHHVVFEGSPAVFHPSPDTCKYCPGRAKCGTRMEMLTRATQEDWKESAPLHELMDQVPQLEAILADIRKEVFTKLAQGVQVPGYKLVHGRGGHRKWEDEERVKKFIKNELPPDEQEKLIVVKPLSPAQMEKKLSKEFVKKNFTVIIPAGKPTLVKSSDPRPALESNEFTADFEADESEVL